MSGGGPRARRGFTTGSAAAAAGAAAVMFLRGEPCSRVRLLLPGGNEIEVPVAGVARADSGAEAWVVKDAGDDPDVTHGAVIAALVELTDDGGVRVDGGAGVGIVTKPGLPVPPGSPAINPGARAIIERNVELALRGEGGARVTVSVPRGEELAARTYNPRLGIVGGISVLGTTGIVNPMSDDAVIGTIKSELSVARASGATRVTLVPGNYGRAVAASLGEPDGATVNMSNFVGAALDAVGSLGFDELFIVGQVGKLAKFAAGSLNTHSSHSDGRMESLAACAAAEGAAAADVREILAFDLADAAALWMLEREWGPRALDMLARRAAGVALARAACLSRAECAVFALPDRVISRCDCRRERQEGGTNRAE